MNKYVNIKISGQSNIGIIDLGKIDITKSETAIANDIKKIIEPKLITALKEHFDCSVKIRLTNVISSVGFIEVKAIVIIESDSEDYVEAVEMSETFMY